MLHFPAGVIIKVITTDGLYLSGECWIIVAGIIGDHDLPDGPYFSSESFIDIVWIIFDSVQHRDPVVPHNIIPACIAVCAPTHDISIFAKFQDHIFG